MIIMFFIPFLTDYGLPEAIGVFVRPICRAIWCVPGRVAVIIVSAFLGNFTVGHMQANMYYTQGKVSHKEALIMCTGFATPSIGLILSLTSAAGAMDYFTLITGLILFSVLVVTSITAHIPPLSRYPDEGYEGMEVEVEEYEKGNIFKAAWNTGVETCIKNSAKTPIVTNAKTFLKSIPTVANISIIGIGSIVFFGLINVYTPLFRLLGYVYMQCTSCQDFPPEEFGLQIPDGYGRISVKNAHYAEERNWCLQFSNAPLQGGGMTPPYRSGTSNTNSPSRFGMR